jgi:hypothetical protein
MGYYRSNIHPVIYNMDNPAELEGRILFTELWHANKQGGGGRAHLASQFLSLLHYRETFIY